MKLEESINHLNDLTHELADLVAYQGELLDSVEKHLGNAVDYIEQANVKLEKTEEVIEKTKKTHKYMEGVFCCIFVALLILFLWLFGVF